MRRIHPAWYVAATTFLALVMASGFRSVTGVLLVPLHDRFGWSHETISLAVFINLMCFGLGAPFAAALVERFGVRRVVGTALGIIGLSALLTTQMTQPWHMYLLWGVVNGLATGAISVPLSAVVATRWFVARRGLVTGLLGASYASGQLVFLPLLAWIAGFDWRWAAVTVGVVALVVVLPIAVAFMRDRPEDAGLKPYGAGEDWVPPPPSVASFRGAIHALHEAIYSRTFWLLAGTFYICGATTNGLVSTHLIPAAHDHGISQIAAASTLAMIGLFDIAGTTASGWLTDRYDPRKLLFAYYALRGLALLALPTALGVPEVMILFAVVYGLDWVATVPPTIALTAKEWGPEKVGVLFGWIFASHQLGAATAAWAAGAVRTGTGGYGIAFLVAGGLAVAAAGAVLVIRSPREQPVQAPVPAAM
jgi:MFS family permease